MKTGEKGKDLIQSFESLALKSYKCPAGVWTIGFGTTRINKKPVLPGMVITVEYAETLFESDLFLFERDVNSLLTKPVTQNQFDALVSFAYNVGSDIDADLFAEGLGDSTLMKKVNANPSDPTIRNEFMKWTKAFNPKTGKNESLLGLVRRRTAEANLYFSI
jgi:lysozyme